MPVPSAPKGIFLSLLCLLLLGTMPVIASSRPSGTDALVFACALSVWQVIFATPVLALERAGGERGIFGAALPGRAMLRISATALVTGAMFGLSTWLYVLGVEKAGAGNAAIAIQAYPLFAILWEWLFLNRRKTAPELALTLTLLAALYLLGTGGTGRMSGLSPWFLVTLGVPFLWSVAHVIIKEELGRTPVTPVQVTFFRVAISTLFLLALLAAGSGRPVWPALAGTLAHPAAVLMGLVYYLELILWFHAVRHIDVSLASSITTPWPALTMALAVPLLGETVAPYQIAALAVILFSIWGLTWARLARTATR